MNRDQLFGGNPAGVLLRLVLLSIVVGIILSALGINPGNILYHLNLLLRRLYDLGFGAVESMLQYFVLGAVIVFPTWLISRLLGAFRSRTDEHKSQT